MFSINRFITIALVVFSANASSAAFIGFDGTASTYNDGFGTDWQVVDVYAMYDGVGGTEALLNVYNTDITTSDSLGFNHNDLADAQGGSWKPSFSFDIAGLYDPERDSYVTIGFVPGATNQTALDPAFDPSTGAFIPSGGGYFNLTPNNPQFAVGGSVHVGHFVWDSARSNGNEANFFSFTADIGSNTGVGTAINFANGSYVWEASVIPEPSTALLISLGLAGLAGARRR